MKILIEAPFKISDKHKIEIEEEAQVLQKYYHNITQMEIYFRADDGTEPNQILAEVRAHITGEDVFASEFAEDYRDALSGALSKVKRQLTDLKSKLQEQRRIS